MAEVIIEDAVVDNSQPTPTRRDISKALKLPYRFSAFNKLVLRDLNDLSTGKPSFYKYSKDQIATFLKDPYTNQKNLRNASIYLYNASPHYRRLIQYFSGLSDLVYVVVPNGIETNEVNHQTITKQYKKTGKLLANMNIQEQFRKPLKVCLREDTFYGTFRVAKDSITIQQLPSDYCDINVIENNVLNVSFDFSYFDSRKSMLPLYSQEFNDKYTEYKEGRAGKWQELKAPDSFAIKCNEDILAYPIPPFVGVFREVFDLEDYKDLKLTKTELENYAMLVMKLGMNNDGTYTMDYNKAKAFWENLDAVLPPEIGSVLSPMAIEKIGFERHNASQADPISVAEQQLYSSAGVSSLLFNNEKATADALVLSVKADQAITYSIVKSIESVINRFLHSYSFGKKFKINILDCSPYNRKELGDMYLKACQYGLPLVSYYCATQGLLQYDMDSMNYLEDTLLNIKEKFVPLQSSATQSGSVGRPKHEIGDVLGADGE